MHKQFTATRDIKFPDSKQYMKFGDVLLFDDTHKSMSIYRNGALIGTVPFSSSGLQEFLRLGWILDPSKNKKVVVVPVTQTRTVVPSPSEAIAAVMVLNDDAASIPMDVEERTIVPATESKKKAKKDTVADEV